MTCLSGFFFFASAGCLLSSSSSSSKQVTTAGRSKQLARSCSFPNLPPRYLPIRSHFSCLGSSSHLPHIPYSVSLFPWSPCPSVRLQPPSPCTTGLNHQISPFLTASNSVHPPIRRPVDVPSLPNHKPSIIQSNPIGAPRWHSLTNLSHPHTRLKQTHYSLTHPPTRPPTSLNCIISGSGTPLHAPPLSCPACLTSVSASASHQQPGSDLPSNNGCQRMRAQQPTTDAGIWH